MKANRDRGLVIAHPVAHLLIGIGLCICSSTTLVAQASDVKMNTVFLSAPALEKMEELISLKPGRSAKTIAATGSMEPALDENYIVIVEERNFRHLTFGDIVIFRGGWTNGASVAHRLVRSHPFGRGWDTKGDHCQAPDPQRLTEDKYRGYVVIAAVHKLSGDVKQFDLRHKLPFAANKSVQ